MYQGEDMAPFRGSRHGREVEVAVPSNRPRRCTVHELLAVALYPISAVSVAKQTTEQTLATAKAKPAITTASVIVGNQSNLL